MLNQKGFKNTRGIVSKKETISSNSSRRVRAKPSSGKISPPFLVPAIIETLKQSEYAAVTHVVPGEADTYCAAAARKDGGTVLTNDSDLLIYDLGPDGTVGSLNELTFAEEISDNQGQPRSRRMVRTRVFRPKHLAKTLKIPDLKNLAYHMLKEPYGSFSSILEQTRDTALTQSEMEERLSEYMISPSAFSAQNCHPTILAHYQSCTVTLDPRISELILASHMPCPSIYLPILFEILTRTSAWSIPIALRRLTYSICMLPHSPKSGMKTVLEHTRKGQTYAPTTIMLLATKHDIEEYAARLHHKLLKTRISFSSLPVELRYRLYALTEIYNYHLTLSLPPPSRELIAAALTGKSSGMIKWDYVHLVAQIEAVLYSLRMMSQVVGFTLPLIEGKNQDGIRLMQILREIQTEIHDLPALTDLMPSREELGKLWKGIDGQEVLDLLAGVLWEEAGEEDEDVTNVIGHGSAVKVKGNSVPMAKHKKKKAKKPRKK